MKTLLNRDETTAFQPVFDKIAEDFSSKLKFTTREEYLEWLIDWKYEMSLLDRLMRHAAYSWKVSVCQSQIKIDIYQKKLNKVKPLDAAENLIIEEIKDRCILDMGLNRWQCYPLALVWYMLILRKAGKIRARAEREKRLQNIVSV